MTLKDKISNEFSKLIRIHVFITNASHFCNSLAVSVIIPSIFNLYRAVTWYNLALYVVRNVNVYYAIQGDSNVKFVNKIVMFDQLNEN